MHSEEVANTTESHADELRPALLTGKERRSDGSIDIESLAAQDSLTTSASIFSAA